MPPQMLALIVGALEAAIQDTPELVAELKSIFAKENPTPADWEALRAKVLAENYADYVPASALPPESKVVELPKVDTAAIKSSAPINETGASAAGETAAEVQKAPETTSAGPGPVEAPAPYLPDGSPNPVFNHLG